MNRLLPPLPRRGPLNTRPGRRAREQRSRPGPSLNRRSAVYITVLRAPGVLWLMVTSLVARLPLAMTGLAIVLRVSRASGSYGEAGAITAVYVVAGAIGSPVWGRLADRSGAGSSSW